MEAKKRGWEGGGRKNGKNFYRSGVVIYTSPFLLLYSLFCFVFTPPTVFVAFLQKRRAPEPPERKNPILKGGQLDAVSALQCGSEDSYALPTPVFRRRFAHQSRGPVHFGCIPCSMDLLCQSRLTELCGRA